MDGPPARWASGADACRADMKELLNLKIKRRESFRPFAPSVLDEHISPNGSKRTTTCPCRFSKFDPKNDRSSLRSPTWIIRASCKRYPNAPIRSYSVIDTFRELTGAPIVLNTSFNENEPVVCEPRRILSLEM
jgi:carbamoyltransferase